MNWGCTSSYFQNLLAPYIFTAVKLHNDENSSSPVKTLLEGPQRTLIKEVCFIGTVPESEKENNNDEDAILEANQEDEKMRDVKNSSQVTRGDEGVDEAQSIEGMKKGEDDSFRMGVALPTVVKDLLFNLHLLPNLESLSEGFTYPYETSFIEYHGNQSLTPYESRIPCPPKQIGEP